MYLDTVGSVFAVRRSLWLFKKTLGERLVDEPGESNWLGSRAQEMAGEDHLFIYIYIR